MHWFILIIILLFNFINFVQLIEAFRNPYRSCGPYSSLEDRERFLLLLWKKYFHFENAQVRLSPKISQYSKQLNGRHKQGLN